MPEAARPGSISSGAALVGADLGPDSTDDFVILMEEADYSFWTHVQTAVFDGTTYASVDHNGIVYGRHVLRGWMLASEAIGIANLADDIKNPTATATAFTLESDQEFNMTVCVEAINIKWARTNAMVGVSMIVHLTGDTATTPIEASI